MAEYDVVAGGVVVVGQVVWGDQVIRGVMCKTTTWLIFCHSPFHFYFYFILGYTFTVCYTPTLFHFTTLGYTTTLCYTTTLSYTTTMGYTTPLDYTTTLGYPTTLGSTTTLGYTSTLGYTPTLDYTITWVGGCVADGFELACINPPTPLSHVLATMQ